MATSKTMEESDVGIFFYISQLPGFRGILKQRYSDFIANEVDTNGNVVHLTCLEPPPPVVEKSKECEARVSDEKSSESKSYEAEIELFRSLAGDSDAEKLESLINQVNSGIANEDSVAHIFSTQAMKLPILLLGMSIFLWKNYISLLEEET